MPPSHGFAVFVIADIGIHWCRVSVDRTSISGNATSYCGSYSQAYARTSAIIDTAEGRHHVSADQNQNNAAHIPLYIAFVDWYCDDAQCKTRVRLGADNRSLIADRLF